MSDLVPVQGSEDALVEDLAGEFSKEAEMEVRVGDHFIGDRYYGVGVITGFKREEGNRGFIFAEIQCTGYNQVHSYASEFRADTRGWAKWIKLHEPLESLKADAVQNFINPSAAVAPNVNSTALTTSGGAELAKAAKDRIVLVVQRRLAIERIAQSMLDRMNRGLSELQEQVAYVTRIVGILETYLGVYQEVVLIQDGLPASPSEPIVMRQQVMYMDEEAGDVTTKNGQEGIDFRRIEDFDAWLLEHLDTFVPQQKCILAFRPSRQSRSYSDHPIVQIQMEHENSRSYLVIRNGGKVYRIWTGISLPDRLFPSAEEYAKISEVLENEDTRRYDLREAKDRDLDWKQIVILFQGLLERTDCLQPYPAPAISLFDPLTYENNYVQLIRDAEGSIGDGKVLFKDWRRRHNEEMVVGSRLYLCAIWRGYERKDYKDRFQIYYSDWNIPDLPPSGIYTVEEIKTKEYQYCVESNITRGKPSVYETRKRYSWRILYMPRAEARVGWGWETKEREKRVSFWVDEGDLVLAYDTPALDDVDYYISSRAERPQYLNVLPILYKLRVDRQADLRLERTLATELAQRLEATEAEVMEAIAWWKFKVKSHRAVMSDDAKAWRMIEKRIKGAKDGN